LSNNLEGSGWEVYRGEIGRRTNGLRKPAEKEVSVITCRV